MTASMPRSRHVRFGVWVSIALVAGLPAACSGDGSAGRSAAPERSRHTTSHPVPTTASPTDLEPPAPGSDCLRAADEAHVIRFGPRRALGGYILGTGSRYVVLGHQSDGDSCQLLPLARRLAAAGYRALAYDSAGVDSSIGADSGGRLADEVLAAVAWCRAHRAASVSLIGASMGGYGALHAALLARPPVAAVVSLSAPSVWDDPAGKPLDITGMSSPTQLWAARFDTEFFGAAKAFARQDPDAQLHVIPGAAHGVQLVPEAFAPIRAFLDAHSR